MAEPVDDDVMMEIIDDDEDGDPFLPFCSFGMVVGSLLRKTKEVDGWEERGQATFAKAKASIKPPRKKRKKPVDVNGEKKDNRPMWARRRPMYTKSKKKEPIHKVFTY